MKRDVSASNCTSEKETENNDFVYLTYIYVCVCRIWCNVWHKKPYRMDDKMSMWQKKPHILNV